MNLNIYGLRNFLCLLFSTSSQFFLRSLIFHLNEILGVWKISNLENVGMEIYTKKEGQFRMIRSRQLINQSRYDPQFGSSSRAPWFLAHINPGVNPLDGCPQV